MYIWVAGDAPEKFHVCTLFADTICTAVLDRHLQYVSFTVKHLPGAKPLQVWCHDLLLYLLEDPELFSELQW